MLRGHLEALLIKVVLTLGTFLVPKCVWTYSCSYLVEFAPSVHWNRTLFLYVKESTLVIVLG